MTRLGQIQIKLACQRYRFKAFSHQYQVMYIRKVHLMHGNKQWQTTKGQEFKIKPSCPDNEINTQT